MFVEHVCAQANGDRVYIIKYTAAAAVVGRVLVYVPHTAAAAEASVERNGSSKYVVVQ